VLYLDNLGAEEDEFLSYSLTEDIIIDLSKAGLVRVPPMRDIIKFKESELSLSELADTLRVQFILTGSIRRDSSQFRLVTQLVEPTKGINHWSEKWEEPFEKITAVKSNIVIDVINILGLSPNNMAVREIGRKPTLNAEAYEFYLKGKFYYRTRKSNADTEIATGFLKKAIELDPEFVLPMVQLGETYREKAEYNSAIEVYEEALIIANEYNILTAKASILNGMAGTNWRLGNMDKAHEYTMQALEVFEKVGDFANEAMVLSNLGILNYTFGNYKITMEYWERALEIDKRLDDKYGESIRLSNISTVYIENGEFKKALEYLMSSVPIYLEFGEQQGLALAYDNIAKVYFHQKKYLLAIEYFQKAIGIFDIIEEKVELLSALSHVALCEAELEKESDALNVIEIFDEKIKLVEEDAIPVIAYWNLYQVYSKFNKSNKAEVSLNHAYRLLMKRAEKIGSSEQREKFLNEISENKTIITTWEKKEKENKN
jgi:TolB-like protein/tetratricopeptide (TPR) repeat protein